MEGFKLHLNDTETASLGELGFDSMPNVSRSASCFNSDQAIPPILIIGIYADVSRLL